MAVQREIDIVARDRAIEVRENHLMLLVETVDREARGQSIASRVAEVAGGAFSTLAITLLSVDSFKSILGMSGEMVEGVFLTLLFVSLITLLLAIYFMRNTKQLLTPRQRVQQLATERVEQLSEAPVGEAKDVIKPPDSSSALFDLLGLVGDSFGVLTKAEAQRAFSALPHNQSLDDVLADATGRDLIALDEGVLSLTELGRHAVMENRRRAERERFFGTNTIPRELPPAV